MKKTKGEAPFDFNAPYFHFQVSNGSEIEEFLAYVYTRIWASPFYVLLHASFSQFEIEWPSNRP